MSEDNDLQFSEWLRCKKDKLTCEDFVLPAKKTIFAAGK